MNKGFGICCIDNNSTIKAHQGTVQPRISRHFLVKKENSAVSVDYGLKLKWSNILCPTRRSQKYVSPLNDKLLVTDFKIYCRIIGIACVEMPKKGGDII